MYILGINCLGPNTAACLLESGRLVAMAEEERFNRIKTAPDKMPIGAIRYCLDRAGIRLADYCVRRFGERGVEAELIDAKAVGLPMLDRMYKEYEPGTAPVAMQDLAKKIEAADAFLFVAGEYNWGVQPGLKNLTDHYLEQWFWRPAALATYSAGRFAGVRAGQAWHPTLSEMGMVVIPSMISVGQITQTLDEQGQPIGSGGASLERSFGKFADELTWWADAAAAQKERVTPPY